MKAMSIEEWGEENIRLVERPDPVAGPGEVVIRIHAVSINPRDLILARGGYGRRGGEPPIIPLCDGAGEIAEIGEGVTGLAVGDRVCPAFSRTWISGPLGPAFFGGAHGGPLDGTMCELMCVPAAAVVLVPSHLSFAEAATLPCAAVTAWSAVVEQGGVRPGDLVLLQGTGGVSLFALIFARMMGAETILISSSDEKLERARALGAHHLINYRTEPDWDKAVKKVTGGRGVDLVVEIGGAGTLEKSASVVRESGCISLIGVLGGAAAELNLGRIVTRNVRLQGVTVGSRDSFAAMCRAMEVSGARPPLDDARFSFDGLAAAMVELSEGRHFGKVVCEF